MPRAGAMRAVTGRAMDAVLPIDAYLRYGVLPVWLAAGLADWWCHRRSRIEATSGLRESLLHLAQLAEVGIPLLAALCLVPGPGVLAMMLAGLALHEWTALRDVACAVSRREVTPLEQHVHSFLEMLPVVSTSMVAWAVLARVLHEGIGPAGFALRWRDPPQPYLSLLLVAVLLFAVLPYGEECLRDIRWARAARHGRATATDLSGVSEHER